jgi:hypothetical protein
MKRVVVTITSIPSRQTNLVKTIQSINNGTLKPDCIYVNLPDFYPIFNEKLDLQFVKKIEELDRVKVNITKDYGTLTDLIPILHQTEERDLVVIVTDNSYYSQYFLEYLVKGYNEFNCAVGFSGIAYPETTINLCNCLRYLCSNKHGQDSEILETTLGFLIPMDQLKIKTINLQPMEQFEPIYFSNDYVWSRLLDRKKFVHYEPIGRNGDDFSKIITPIETNPNHSLSRSGNNLKNFFNSKDHEIFTLKNNYQ